MRFRFIHAADLHLDTPYSGLGLGDEGLAARLRDASLAAFDRIVAHAVAVDAAFVVLAGDLYDGVERGVRAQLRVHAGVSRLAERGIATFVAHGNHDPLGGHWSAVRTWPEGVTFFAAGAPQSVPVVRAGQHLATVHGVSYGARAERENLARRFPVADSPGLHVGVLHASVEGQPGHAPYAPCSLADLRSRGYGYWALGHVHRHAVLSRDPWVVYSGNTQGRSFGSGELGPKGALVVHVEDGAVRRVEAFPTDTARFFELPADIADHEDLGGLGASLLHAAEALAAEHPDVALVVRARLRGRGDLHRELHAPETRAALLETLRDQAPGRVHWVGLALATAPALDLGRIAAAGDLRAAVLATYASWTDDGGPRQGLPRALLAELDTLGRPDAAVLAEHLAEARWDVLERLSGEEG